MTEKSPRVGLFVTCLVDLFRPSVGFAAVKLLEQAGCSVEVPASQTCCGQPAYNSGDRPLARDLLSRLLYGSQATLIVGVVANGIALVIGAIIGMTATVLLALRGVRYRPLGASVLLRLLRIT